MAVDAITAVPDVFAVYDFLRNIFGVGELAEPSVTIYCQPDEDDGEQERSSNEE